MCVLFFIEAECCILLFTTIQQCMLASEKTILTGRERQTVREFSSSFHVLIGHLLFDQYSSKRVLFFFPCSHQTSFDQYSSSLVLSLVFAPLIGAVVLIFYILFIFFCRGCRLLWLWLYFGLI